MIRIMAKRYTDEWKKKVSEGLKNYREKHPFTIEQREKLAEYARKANRSRVYKIRPLHELKSEVQIRKRLLNERGRKCEKCGWKEKNPFYSWLIPVQINHKDGNPDNNKEENLEVLCPNCHSLSEFYMCFGRRPKEPNSRTLKRYRHWGG